MSGPSGAAIWRASETRKTAPRPVLAAALQLGAQNPTRLLAHVEHLQADAVAIPPLRAGR